jgi:hypothetical protein
LVSFAITSTVAAVDERHLDRRGGQGLGRCQAGEAAADDEDPREWLRAAHDNRGARPTVLQTHLRQVGDDGVRAVRPQRGRVLGGADPLLSTC